MEIISKFECYFCNTVITSTHLDVSTMFITINWDKHEEHRFYKQFFCHLMCFKKKIDQNMPLYLEFLGEDEGYDDYRTDEEACESIAHMLEQPSSEEVACLPLQPQALIKEPVYTCCFCSKSIESSAVDITSLLVAINWDKVAEKQYDQQFFSHLVCFQNRMHPDLVPSPSLCI